MSIAIVDKPINISGVHLLERVKHGDQRGYFERLFCVDTLKQCGWHQPVAQINHSYTEKVATIRGLHFQIPPFAEYKLVMCLRGRILDVVVDVRENSPTYLQHVSIELNEENGYAIVIPPGCAHGFQTLIDGVELLYCHSEQYAPQSEGGLHCFDPQLNIKWPLKVSEQSKRDTEFSFITPHFKGMQL